MFFYLLDFMFEFQMHVSWKCIFVPTSVAIEFTECEEAPIGKKKSANKPHTSGVVVRNASELTGNLHTWAWYFAGSLRWVIDVIQHGRVCNNTKGFLIQTEKAREALCWFTQETTMRRGSGNGTGHLSSMQGLRAPRISLCPAQQAQLTALGSECESGFHY